MAENFEPLLRTLEKQGSKKTDLQELRTQVEKRMNGNLAKEVPELLCHQIRYLLRHLKETLPEGLKNRAIGALLNFLNRDDVDRLPMLGHLNDCAILALVNSAMSGWREQKENSFYSTGVE